MEDKNSSSQTQQTLPSSSNNKKKKGVFPRLSLKKTLELPRAIYEIGQGEPVRRLKVFDHLGKSAGSGPSRTLIIVAGMYGLTTGGFQAEYLSITDIGKKLIQSEDLAQAYDILFSNEIFSKFVEYWKDKTLPEDDIATDWLVRTFSLVQQDAKSFWEVIRENLQDYRLVQQYSGKRVVISKEVAVESSDQGGIIPEDNDRIVSNRTEAELFSPTIQISDKQSSPIQAIDIDLENGGKARIIVPSHKEITKADVKRMKAQIDIFSNFIDEEK